MRPTPIHVATDICDKQLSSFHRLIGLFVDFAGAGNTFEGVAVGGVDDTDEESGGVEDVVVGRVVEH